MEKILVTTDLSPNSVAGLHFAIRLSTQKRLRLIFLHVNKLMEDDIFPNPEHRASVRKEREELQRELTEFVKSVYKSMKLTPEHYQCALYYRFGVVNSIIEYAENNQCDYICVSTHGTGNLGKLFGTTTGKLITESTVPVLCIPKNYQIKPVTRLLYASDMVSYEQELNKVAALAKSVNADIDVLHFSPDGTDFPDKFDLNKELQGKFQRNIIFHLKSRDTNTTLLEDIDRAVADLSPSILIMFTVQDRTLFDLLFFSSKSEKYSFRTKVPLLVFNKSRNNKDS